jgi:hypothetical protein
VRNATLVIAAALLLPLTAQAATRAYFVEPKKLHEGKAAGDEQHGIRQSFIANVDSISYLEWFVAELSAAGKYVFEIRDAATNDLVCEGSETLPARGWGWIRCDSFYAGGRRFTKGRQYLLKVHHDQGDSVNYVYRTDNPYSYGLMMVPGQQPPIPLTWDLCARVYGRMNAAAATGLADAGN